MWAGAIHTIKSADQQTADFVSEKDVKARSKAEQKQSKSRAKAEQKQSKSRAKAGQQARTYLSDLWRSNCGRGLAPDSSGSVTAASTDTPSSGASPLPHLDGVGAENPVGSKAAAALLLI
jgi:hypothetical protein